MANSQFNFVGVLLVVLAIPAWAFLVVTVPNSVGWGSDPVRFVMAPIVLCGITAAIHRLLRRFKDAWPLSALIAGLGVLAILAWMAFG